MQDKRPYFSVVLPTANRSQYLASAIKSVLQQSFEDFELIVSDNSSTDGTADLVGSFSDSRIRYARTSRRLPMHESWEFAFAQSAGEHVTFLGDDDAYSAIYLESMARVIGENNPEMASCRLADYRYEAGELGALHWPENSLSFQPFTNQLSRYDTASAVESLYGQLGLCDHPSSPAVPPPLLINTVYKRSVLTKCHERLGWLWDTLSGDYYLAAVTLGLTDTYFYLDSPLAFHGISPGSTTSSISNALDGVDLKKRQPELAHFREVPVELYVPYNFSADALLLAKCDLRPELDSIDLDLTGYFKNIYIQLCDLEVLGADVTRLEAALHSAIDEQPAAVRDKVRSFLHAPTMRTKRSMRLRLSRSKKVYSLFRKVLNRKESISTFFSGAQNGFTDIAQCAALVDEGFLREYKSGERK